MGGSRGLAVCCGHCVLLVALALVAQCAVLLPSSLVHAVAGARSNRQAGMLLIFVRC
jgi:hypothetical protein